MDLFGIFLLGIGFLLFLSLRNQKRKLFSVQRARSMTAAEVQETAGAVAAEIGGGSWRDYVKLWGEVTVDQPLLSDQKQKPCVHYQSTVSQVYETKNDEGDLIKKSKTVSSNQETIQFWLRDRTGKIRVDPDGAAIETIEIMDEFRPERSGTTLGYRYVESVLPVGREVLVVGAVSDLTGEVIIGQPVQSDHHYIISLKNEEMLTHTSSRNVKTNQRWMVACFVLGIILLVLGLLF